MPTYQGIEKIQIAAFAPGMFRNAIIFSADFDIGFTDKPTKFIINAVNQIGNYDIKEEDLSYLDPYDISFGPFQFKFFLESYQIQKSAGKKLLQLTFVDGSTLLDRIYVALGDKHRKLHEAAWAPYPVNFPVLCDTPNFYPSSKSLVNLSQQTLMPIKSAGFDFQSIIKDPTQLEAGGMITVGWETPTLENFHKDCSIADFKYNFSHLLWMIERFGINVGGDFLKRNANGDSVILPNGEKVFADRNPFHYRSYGGQTLRQVLNSWCKVQGYSWTYDWQQNGIMGIDKHSMSGIAKFETIKTLVNSVVSQDADGNKTNILIEKSTESVSLEGTKKKYVTTKAIKNAKPDNPTNYDYYRPIKFGPLDTSHILAPNQRGGITGFNNAFRDDTQFKISCGLAKFNENAREIYNVGIGAHEATGIKILAEIDMAGRPPFNVGGVAQPALGAQAATEALLQSAQAERQGLVRTMNRWTQYWNIPFKIYFVKYDEKLAKKWIEWEKNMANDFFGKYYLNFDKMEWSEQCDAGGNGVFRRKDETVPSSTVYTKDNVISSMTPFPFSKSILRGPYGLRIGVNNNLFAFFNQLNMLSRDDATWGTSDAEVEGLLNPLRQQNSDILAQWAPRFIPLENQNVLGTLLAHLNIGQNQAQWGNAIMWPGGGGVNAQRSAQAFLNAIANQNNSVSNNFGQKIGLYIHPDYNHPKFPWKVKNASFTRYENTKEKSIKDSGFLGSSHYDSCPILCGGISQRQRLCEDLNRQFESRPLPTGIERWNLGTFNNPNWGLPAFGFQMEYTYPPTDPPPAAQVWNTETLDIIYPTWSAYLANHKINIFRRILDPKIMVIINQMEGRGAAPPGNVGSVEMIENDVSGWVTKDPTSGELEIALPGMGIADPWSLGGNFFRNTDSARWDYMQIMKYHNQYVINSEVPRENSMLSTPRKTLSCSVAGMHFGSLAGYLSPVSGLESMSIRMSDEGVVSELRFSNKPPEKADQSVLFRSIETDLIRAGGVYPMF
jgi:hypothetical protein